MTLSPVMGLSKRKGFDIGDHQWLKMIEKKSPPCGGLLETDASVG
jgi:hypothetical protein